MVGVLNEGEVAHDVALSLTGENVAKTEATIDLNGKSFSASIWVNYSTDGTLLTHGTSDNNFNVAIDCGKLVISVAGQKVTSADVLPKDKWLYLNVSYDAEGETLYNSINKSYSSCGDEYLYYRLRHIDIDTPKEERDRFIYQTDSLILDEVNRIKLQLSLATLGKTGRHSVFEYIS